MPWSWLAVPIFPQMVEGASIADAVSLVTAHERIVAKIQREEWEPFAVEDGIMYYRRFGRPSMEGMVVRPPAL